MSEWMKEYEALEAEIRLDPQFPEVVRCYGGRPQGSVPSRRAARLATRICERMGLDHAIYRGNVFGAAAHKIDEQVPV